MLELWETSLLLDLKWSEAVNFIKALFLTAHFKTLKRHFLSYIITYYLPSGLFVAVSWISFLIPPDIVPGRAVLDIKDAHQIIGRMALLVTLFLVLVNIFNNVTTNSPKAEGLTAIEIWMLAFYLSLVSYNDYIQNLLMLNRGFQACLL